MKINLIRGQNQIGGTIIEITTDKTRIFLDVGVELSEKESVVVPEVEGLFVGEPRCDGVIISHYHSDHLGLTQFLLPEVPIYIGANAYNIVRAAYDYRGLSFDLNAITFVANQKFCIGDIEVTPYLCDHSAYDSYMFLIEADGKSVLYTGDFRANGRLDFQELLTVLPHVDLLLIEGTTLAREENRKNIEEEDLEKIGIEYLKQKRGPAFILMSAMNIDRLITANNIAKATSRVFLEDLYTADIVSSLSSELPNPNRANNVRVFTTGGNSLYQRLQKYGDAKIGKREIANTPFLMCIRQSMANYLEKLNELVSFEDGVLFYGMWKGYMEQPEMKEFLAHLEQKGIKIHILHTSGHADVDTIKALIEATKPIMIAPIHTENADWFKENYPTTKVHTETKEIELQ